MFAFSLRNTIKKPREQLNQITKITQRFYWQHQIKRKL